MSVRRLTSDQPESFAFTPENLDWANAQLKKFPEGKEASAVIPLLWRAQEQHGGWLPEPAMRVVADMLNMAYIRVLEIATFYTMFNLSPVGTHFVQLCGTTPCWLRGADDLKEVCRRVIGEPGELREDGQLSWIEVECLGACVNAPMVQINDDYYEDLDAGTFEQILHKLRNGEEVAVGPQVDRQLSAPQTGLTTLTGVTNGHAPDMSFDEAPEGGGSEEQAGNAERPPALDGARAQGADDLKRISGVGAKIEEILNGLGIYHYDQIAQWSEANINWVDDHLKFKGRILREDWCSQAKTLAEGGQTEFAENYDDDAKGDG